MTTFSVPMWLRPGVPPVAGVGDGVVATGTGVVGAGGGVVTVSPGYLGVNWGAHTGPLEMFTHCTSGIASVCPTVRLAPVVRPFTCAIALGRTPYPRPMQLSVSPPRTTCWPRIATPRVGEGVREGGVTTATWAGVVAGAVAVGVDGSVGGTTVAVSVGAAVGSGGVLVAGGAAGSVAARPRLSGVFRIKSSTAGAVSV